MDPASILIKMTDYELRACWKALQEGDDGESYNGLDYANWTELVYSELNIRNLPR